MSTNTTTVGPLVVNNGPVDARTVVSTVSDLTTVTQAYAGMRIFVKENNKEYKVTEVEGIFNTIKTATPLPYSEITQSDIISWNGKQAAIDSSHKISADNVQDGTTNKVVTQTEKTTWNGKQDALTTEQLSNIAKGGTALQPSSTSGLLKNDGTVDIETQSKAANAIQMPSGASSDKVLGYDNGAVAWVEKPSDGQDGADGEDGLNAYEVWLDENGYDASQHDVNEFLEWLKAHISKFIYEAYDDDAAGDISDIGDAVTSNSGAIGITTPSASTKDVILLMPNNDAVSGTAAADATMMFATIETSTQGEYEFVYVGSINDLDASTFVEKSQIVNDLTTGGSNKVLSAEAGKELGKELYGDNTEEWQEITEGIIDGAYYSTNSDQMPAGYTSNSDTTNHSCLQLQVAEGDKFKLSTIGNNGYVRGWVFTDENRNKLLQDTNASSRTVYDNVELPAAPENAYYLYINTFDKTNYPISLSKEVTVYTPGLVERVEDLENVGVPKFQTLEVLDNVSIVDNLDSDNPHDVLSAKQGKVINEQLNGKEGFAVYTEGFQDNTYIDTHVNSLLSDRGSLDSTASIITPCTEGDIFRVYGKGNSDYVQLYAFAYNGTYVDKPAQNLNTRDSGLVLPIPEGVNQLIINLLDYDAQTDKLEKWVKTQRGIVDDVEDLQEEVSSLSKKSVIDGKTIVVFGDSITENKIGGISWTDLAGQISGATFINVAIGGTDLRSRVPLITKFDATKSYASGDRVYYGTPDEMRCYLFTSAHSGAWTGEDVTEVSSSNIYAPLDICNMVAASCDINTEIEHRFDNQVAAAQCVKYYYSSDDNTDIITRLSEIDWTNVDAVIIAGGANDFGYTSLYGTSGDVDSDATNTTFSSINFIVKNLSSTYPTIPIYGVKQLVRWWGWRDNNNTLETWCDNYTNNDNSSLTYGELLEKIREQYAANHIPVIDWYDELGWNKYNFGAYFGDHSAGDGTHPKTAAAIKGMAEKVVSFIIANKVFE